MPITDQEIDNEVRRYREHLKSAQEQVRLKESDPEKAYKEFREVCEDSLGALAKAFYGDPKDASTKAERKRRQRMIEGFKKGRAA